MSSLSKVGKTLEYGLYIAFIGFAIKVILSILAGYVFYSPKNAGAVFYRWRIDYCDVNASKNAYAFIDPNRENETEHFKKFIGTIQEELSTKKYQKELKGLEAELENAKDNKAKETEIQKKIADLKALEHKTKHSVNGNTPLYLASFTDNFELSPGKIYKIYEFCIEKMENEFNFLAFRRVFIQFLSNKGIMKDVMQIDGTKKPVNPKNYVSIPEHEVIDFFTNYKNVDLKEKFKIEFGDALTNGFKTYVGAYDSFSKIIKFLEDDKKKDEFIANISDDDKVIVNQTFFDLIHNFVIALNIKSELTAEGQDFKESFEGFLTRLCLLKPTIFDIRILNRFYYYYLYTVSYLEPEVHGEGADSKYAELSKKYNECVQAAISGKGNLSDIITRRNVYHDKMTKRRVELIFNKLSLLIANKLEKGGAILKAGNDNRNFLLQMLGCYPRLYDESDNKGKEVLFKKI